MPFVVTGMLIVTTSTWSEWSGVDSGKISFSALVLVRLIPA
jgi:hypothetical protein